MNDGKELLIIYVIISLSRGESFGEIGARVEIAVGVFLHEDAARGSEGGVSHDKERFSMVWEREDGLFQKCILNLGEGDFMVDRPLPLSVFVGERKKRFC